MPLSLESFVWRRCIGQLWREGGEAQIKIAHLERILTPPRDGGCGSVAERGQSQKNPVSVSEMLTGKFLQIQKVFAKSTLLAEELPDTLQYKISR